MDGSDLRRIALGLDGVTEAPHFDRAAFRTARIFVTLAADGKTANFKFTPDQQAFKCLTAPDAFAPVAGGWGRMGYTMATLAHLTKDELESALELAHANAGPAKTTTAKAANKK